MDKHTIRVLEYDKVLGIVARYAATDAGRQRVLELKPLLDKSEVTARMAMISEMKSLFEWGKPPPIAGVYDVRDAVSRAKVPGAVLDARSLLLICSVAKASRLLRRFFSENREKADRLWRLSSNIRELGELERKIDAAIDDDTNIKDDASPDLRRIRREKARVSARISSTLSDILAKENFQSHLRENIVTIRNGRYVIPVRAEAKSKISGIVHDTSQSGATVFIEPMTTVNLNNTLRTLELEEKDEIVRILSGLTDAVRESAGEVAVNLEILTEIDVMNAGSRFSMDFSGQEPALNDEGVFVLRAGRHPLLIETQRANDGDGVVPLDMKLEAPGRGLLITGPNAGGKTVALKTIGILTLLARTGLHIPCGDGSSIALFNRVYADIGDEQSIELSLSTFTSHMKNIIRILKDAGTGTLVLLDEVGAGTDPMEGAALARTIIEELLRKRATVVATTHHMSLKVFAHDSEVLENASMEFDGENLKPTYRLVQGLPGASHAFEIASRLGLGEGVLDKARAYCGEEGVRFEELTRDLLEKMRQLAVEEANIEAKRKKADEVLAEYEARLDEIRRYGTQVRKQALKEAKSVVDDARRTASQLVRELKRTKPPPEQARAIEKKIREKAGTIAEEIEKIEGAEEAREPLKQAVVGARAYVKPLAKEGVILSEADEKGRVEIVVGALRVEVGLEDLFEPVEEARKPASAIVHFEAKEVASEIDVRGMTSEDAWETVDKYLDDAALFGHTSIRIIHGKGKGILSKRIREMLSSHPRVKTHRFGDLGEGGTGVTVVEIEGG
jgi:DNA mismatch repair protein MutS2